jgi:hypothetical protein
MTRSRRAAGRRTNQTFRTLSWVIILPLLEQAGKESYFFDKPRCAAHGTCRVV